MTLYSFTFAVICIIALIIYAVVTEVILPLVTVRNVEMVKEVTGTKSTSGMPYAQYPNGLQLNEEHEWLTVEQCREFARVNGYAYMVYKDEVMCVHEDDKSCGLCDALMCDVDLDTKDLRILNTLSATKTPWLHECISNTTYYGNYITWFEQRAGEGEKQVTKQYYQVLNKAMKHKRIMDILNK